MTNRIVVGPLTDGAVSNGYLNVREHRDFFPADAMGGSSSEAGEGVPIRCHFAGMEGVVETDIAGDKMILRDRGAVARLLPRTRIGLSTLLSTECGSSRPAQS